MGSFSSLNVSRLGIYSAQKGLDVTGNNITNINTTGYSRQRVDQISLYSTTPDKYYSSYHSKVGQGVVITGISQLRDPGLDIAYRNASADVGSLDAKLAGYEDLAVILDEVGKGDLDQKDGVILRQMNDLRDLINKANTEGIEGYDSLIRSSAAALTSLFNSYSEKLDELQTTYESYYEQDVDTVNTILSNIQELNVTIRNAEIRGDNALELKDERNLQIDALSSFLDIDVDYSMEQLNAGVQVEQLHISLKGGDSTETLIDGNFARQLTTGSPPDYMQTLTPMYDQNGDIHSTMNVDIALTDNATVGSIQSLREILTEKGEYSTPADIAADVDATIKRGIPYYQESMDVLARTFAEAMNSINTAPAGVEGAGALFSMGSNTDDVSAITAGNISVSQSWSTGAVSMVSKSAVDAPSGDRSNLAKFLNVFGAEHTFTPTDPTAAAATSPYSGTMEDMLLNIQATLAEDQMTTTSVLTNAMITKDTVYTDRDSVMGVDLNDEATNLLIYQKAYTAAARLMTTIDEALEVLMGLK